jgi:hypothetical protein
LPNNILAFNTTTASVLGLNESIIVSYIINECSHGVDAKKSNQYHLLHNYIFDGDYCWVKLNGERLGELFPFWSGNTIRRSLLKLEELGVLESVKKNGHPLDRTKSYRVNNEVLGNLKQD